MIKGFEEFKHRLATTIENSKDEEELADNLGLVAHRMKVRVLELKKRMRQKTK